MKEMKMILMRKGITDNGFEITEEMILNSLDTFANTPIIFNKNQELKDYTDNVTANNYYNEHPVGIIKSVEYKDDVVIGNVIYYKE